MSRRNARELVFHVIFEYDFSGKNADEILSIRLEPEYYDSLASEGKVYSAAPESAQMEYIQNAVRGVIEHSAELDGYISSYSSGWDISRISRICKCILKLSMYEMMYMNIPVKASVNEAIELIKQYDDENAAPFVNGILATFIKKELSET